MSKEPLFVIDCQDYFLKRIKSSLETTFKPVDMENIYYFRQYQYKRFISSVCENVTKAVAENRWIIIVEYDLSDEEDVERKNDVHTVNKIKKILVGYRKVRFVKKQDNSVWQYLGNTMKTIGNPKSVVICGVNLNACVMESVMDFTNNGIRVKVIEEATRNCTNMDEPKKYLQTAGFANHFLVGTVKSL